jgi:hypothetical protein
MDFLGLKIAAVLFVFGSLYYLYRKYRAELTADALMSDVKAAVTKLETWVANEAKNVEAAVAAKAKQEAAVVAQQADVQKVTTFINKVKTAIGA